MHLTLISAMHLLPRLIPSRDPFRCHVFEAKHEASTHFRPFPAFAQL